MSLQSLAQQHKAALIRRDVALADQLAAQYQAAWQSFTTKLLKLLDEMGADQDPAHDQQYWGARLRQIEYSLLPLVQYDFGTFSRAAQNLIKQQIQDAAQRGSADALDLLKTSLPHLGFQFGVPSERALDALIQRLSVDQLFKKMDFQTYDLIRKRLVAGLMTGEGPRETARALARALQMPLNRTLTIARTEMMGAYRTGALQTYRANADVVQGWTWLASSGACPFCTSMNGQHFSLDTPLDSHPNCRCTMTPDVKSYEEILQSVA